MENEETPAASDDEEQRFETTPEQATSADGGLKPGVFNRKKVLIYLLSGLAVIFCGGIVWNYLKPQKNPASSLQDGSSANRTSTEFLASMRDQAIIRNSSIVNSAYSADDPGSQDEIEFEDLELLPSVSFNSYGFDSQQPGAARPASPQSPAVPAAPSPQGGGGGTGSSQSQPPTYYASSLVPSVQGGLYSQYAPQAPAAQPQSQAPLQVTQTPNYGAYSPAGSQSGYASQNDQEGKQSFAESSSGSGFQGGGTFLGENSLWTGTVIPAVLITAINTDLPGNVIARVTQNIYDSSSGRRLLVPQGTILIARYNSSVSYAQSRVQIVWDTMIRPDGFQLELEGAGGVDRSGMSGQAGKIDEHWFEYLKAAGIITMFSYANSKMTETAARYAAGEAAANIASANSDVVSQLSENIVSRALDIQPTLTVDNGTPVNIMLNKTLYIPPVAGNSVTQRYILE